MKGDKENIEEAFRVEVEKIENRKQSLVKEKEYLESIESTEAFFMKSVTIGAEFYILLFIFFIFDLVTRASLADIPKFFAKMLIYSIPITIIIPTIAVAGYKIYKNIKIKKLDKKIIEINDKIDSIKRHIEKRIKVEKQSNKDASIEEEKKQIERVKYEEDDKFIELQNNESEEKGRQYTIGRRK